MCSCAPADEAMEDNIDDCGASIPLLEALVDGREPPPAAVTFLIMVIIKAGDGRLVTTGQATVSVGSGGRGYESHRRPRGDRTGRGQSSLRGCDCEISRGASAVSLRRMASSFFTPKGAICSGDCPSRYGREGSTQDLLEPTHDPEELDSCS
mmetsp:Transcript_157302/g.301823  ORF Transcript_157302/g.301823 Transcript_157302/m.301823 type:complete len:152 (+) Transcript_157302:239-694(+)